MPVEWATIDERNTTLDYSMLYHNNELGQYDTSYWILPTDCNNYNGSVVAEEMMDKMNDGRVDDQHTL